MTRQRSLFAVWLAGLIASLTTSVVLAQSAPDIPAERVSKTEHYTLRALFIDQFATVNDAHRAASFRHDHAPAGQKRDAPGVIKPLDDRQRT